MMYELGTSDVLSSGAGVAMSLNRGGHFTPVLIATGSNGVQQTEAAKRAAPPRKAPTLHPVAMWGCLFPIIWAVVAFGVGAILLVGLALMAAGGGSEMKPEVALTIVALGALLSCALVTAFVLSLVKKWNAWNTKEWPGRYARWGKTWGCLMCGEMFTFDASKP
jgi:hypothetical protein